MYWPGQPPANGSGHASRPAASIPLYCDDDAHMSALPDVRGPIRAPDLNDPAQFAAAFQVAVPRLQLWIRHFSAYTGYQEDIVQETALLAWEHRHTFTARGSTTGWFLAICRTAARRVTEPDAKSLAVTIGDTLSIEDGWTESGEYRLVAIEDDRLALVNALPPQRRKIMLMRFLHELPVSEICARLNLRPGTVWATISQARTWLRTRDPADRI